MMEDNNNGHPVCSLKTEREANEERKCCGETQVPKSSRFSKVCRAVCLMLKVCKGMVKYANLGIMDFDSIKLNLDSSEEGLAFDKDRYRRRKEFRWPAVYLETARKSPASRTHYDIRALQKLMRGLRSFRKFGVETQKEICRYVKYERYTRNRVIVKRGHTPQGVYFLFSGTVAETFSDPVTGELHHPEVRLYRRGDMFGVVDIAFDQPRSTTVVCDDFTEVLMLDINEIKHTGLPDALGRETFHIVDLLRNKSDVSSLSEKTIHRLVSTGYPLTFEDQKVVEVWSRQPRWVYVVYKGSCDVIKRCSTDDLPEKLRGNLAKLLDSPDTGNGTASIKTLNHQEEEELTNRQKLLRFIDTSDNNVRSKVVSSWSRKRPGSEAKDEVLDIMARENSPSALRRSPARLSPQSHGSQSPDNCSKTDDVFGNNSSSSTVTDKGKRSAYLNFTLRHLEPGAVFGTAFLQTENRDVFFLSKGCTVIAIPTSVFLMTSPSDVKDDISRSLSAIPNGDDLCSKYAKCLIWGYFKNNFIESLRSESREDVSTPNGRRSHRAYYLRNVIIPTTPNNPQIFVNNRMAYTPDIKIASSRHVSTTGLKSTSLRLPRPDTVLIQPQLSMQRIAHRCSQVVKSTPPGHRTKSGIPSSKPSHQARCTSSMATCRLRPALTGVRHVLQLLPDRI